jgi:hypothetical protein
VQRARDPIKMKAQVIKMPMGDLPHETAHMAFDLLYPRHRKTPLSVHLFVAPGFDSLQTLNNFTF